MSRPASDGITRSVPGAIRTRDLPLRRRILFQLRYGDSMIVAGLVPAYRAIVVIVTGFEPASSRQKVSSETRFPIVAHRTTRREFHPAGTTRCIRNRYLSALCVLARSVREPG